MDYLDYRLTLAVVATINREMIGCVAWHFSFMQCVAWLRIAPRLTLTRKLTARLGLGSGSGSARARALKLGK